MLESILIAIAICIDSFALGITYGIRKIKIPKIAILTINLVTICTLGITVFFGQIIRQFISHFTASFISSIILICLGSFLMLEGYIKHLIGIRAALGDQKLVNLHIPKLGIIIDIAFDVTKADLDISGDINIKEAMYIGFILSIDSIGAGFGYAMGSTNVIYFMIFVFFINILSITYGLNIGHRIVNQKNTLKTSLLPGIILVTIGLLRWVW